MNGPITVGLALRQSYEVACTEQEGRMRRLLSRISDGTARQYDVPEQLAGSLTDLAVLYLGNEAYRTLANDIPIEKPDTQETIEALGKKNAELLVGAAQSLVSQVDGQFGFGEVHSAAAYLRHKLCNHNQADGYLWDGANKRPITPLVPFFTAVFENHPRVLKQVNLAAPRGQEVSTLAQEVLTPPSAGVDPELGVPRNG